MKEVLEYVFKTEGFWPFVWKLITTITFTSLIGFICTLLGKIIANCKHSKLRKHAKIAVEAAEQKFPNEGVKMGPEKMAYVMDYLAITFPKIKSNQYLYNIAEAAVFELNKDKEEKDSKAKFKAKYGELPETLINKNKEEISEPNEIKTETKKIMNIF